MKVRTRFAPSPTGYMHIGNLRTALYEYLIAKTNGGDFILRIEDTDQKRFVEGAEEIIYNTLKRVGMNWDEGPDIGGNYGPYVQSQRKPLYAEYAHKLVELGGAHYCFCSAKKRVRVLPPGSLMSSVRPFIRPELPFFTTLFTATSKLTMTSLTKAFFLSQTVSRLITLPMLSMTT